MLLVPVPKCFQGQSSHVLTGEEKQLGKMMGMYFLQGNCHEENSNNTILHNALQEQGEGEEETKFRHNALEKSRDSVVAQLLSP